MPIHKTYFEQVPMETVRKIIAEQTRQQEAVQHEPETGSDAVKATPQDAHDKSLEKSSELFPLEVWTLW